MATPNYRNLYEQVFILQLENRGKEAEALLASLFQSNPANPEAVWAWTDLCCKQRRHEEARPRVAELLQQAPDNPYYILADLFINMAAGPAEHSDHIPFPVHETLEHAVNNAEDSPDALAKIAFLYTISGNWTAGMDLFLKALYIATLLEQRDDEHYLQIDQLVIKWFDNIEAMDETEDLNDVPITIASQAACLLIGFDKYFPEARLTLHNLLVQHKKLGTAARNGQLKLVLTKHCPEAHYITDHLTATTSHDYTGRRHQSH